MEKKAPFNIKRYFRLTPKKLIISSVIFAAIRIVFSIAWPYLLFRQLFDKDNIDLDAIYRVVPFVLVLFGISQYATFKQLLINTKIIDSSSLDLISELWKKMVSLEWLEFKAKNRAYFFDIYMFDSWRIRLGIMAIIESILPYSIISLFLLVFVFYISPPIFILYAVGFVLTSIMQLLSNYNLRPVIRNFHNAWRKQTNNVGISVDKYDLIRMERGKSESYSKFKTGTKSFLQTNSGLLIAQSRWKIIIQVVIQFTRLLVLIIGVYWIKLEIITWAEFFFTIFIIGIIQTNLSQLPHSVNVLLEALESFKKVNEFLQLKSENNLVSEDSFETGKPIEKIEIKGLNFAYEGRDQLFNDYSFSLEKGKIYLWTGRNGCGKSTLSHILLGLIQPDSGKISINDKSISWDELRMLRSKFAFIHQDAILYASSIKDNITFGHEDQDKVWGQMQKSWLSDLLPNGKNIAERIIGERGEGLSGGESRRLILIREWLHSSDLIIFDEPLNHLDTQSITQITDEILHLKKNAIVVIISHQKGFEAAADEVIRIDER